MTNDSSFASPLSRDALIRQKRDSAGWLMKSILLLMRAEIDPRMEEVGLTDAQWVPILQLASGEAHTAAELARGCMQSAGGVTRMLDRLEAKGFVERVRSSDDRRVVNLALTPEGACAAQEVPVILREINEQALAGLTPEEIAQFKGYLRRVLEALESRAAQKPAPTGEA